MNKRKKIQEKKEDARREWRERRSKDEEKVKRKLKKDETKTKGENRAVKRDWRRPGGAAAWRTHLIYFFDIDISIYYRDFRDLL